jgi:heme-degrading monooxygenase HmoA
MILEVAPLRILADRAQEFEAAFAQAERLIASMPGCLSHELQRCLEQEDLYLLLVRWKTLADHEQGFRKSAQYQSWKALLHHFYDPFPTVLHFRAVADASAVRDAHRAA